MFAPMPQAYRQDEETGQWHSFQDCPDWPQLKYVESLSAPQTEHSTVTYCKKCFARQVQADK